jgi:DNA invertase Pin-like site-specific DNA recombinase
LLKALADCKRSRAKLVIAKFDRLSRNVAFLANLLESGVDFVACDNPHANRLTVHILAAVAENEAKMISERTKSALAAYKARGGVLGAARPDGRHLSPEASARGRQLASETIRVRASEAYADLSHVVRQHRENGMTLQAIADQLNEDGHVTRQGKPWNKVQVMRVLDRSKTTDAS